ncbi:hypothetical protein KR084_010792, partial [Drosophila pseudotakahashii]
MRDLKQRLFDLLRSNGSGSNNNNSGGGSNSNTNNSSHSNPNKANVQHLPAQKPKKLHEYTAADCNAAFLRKYHDLSISRDRDREMDRSRSRNRERERAGPGHGSGAPPGQSPNVIYFNENLSMASKYSVRPFPLTRYPSCPLSSFGISPGSQGSQGHQPQEGSAGSSLGEEEDTESEEPYHFCSDEDRSTSHTQTIKMRRHHHHGILDMNPPSANEEADLEDMEHLERAESQLDSFCTLCTSTFSYNKCCRYCENSLCGSKCNSERGSHASRMSQISQMSQISRHLPPDPEFDPHQNRNHNQNQLQPHRFGGSMRMLANHQPAAIR